MKLRRLFVLAAAAVACVLARGGAGWQLYVGTYTPKGGESRGIYTVTFDRTTGAVGEAVLGAETANPSFLALRPDGRVLYALDESGGTGGGIAAFEVDRRSGELKLLNRQTNTGAGTAHVAVDAIGRMAVTASYNGGQIAAFPLGPDGRLGTRSVWLMTAGPTGPNIARQDRPHPHSVTFSPDNRFAYACDLGLDRIFCYRTDPATAKLVPAEPSVVATASGAGPRHSVFSRDGRSFYVINELNGTIAAYRCDPATGLLIPGPVISTLPAGFAGTNTCAEIAIHPNDRFIYGSNRGHDSLAVFARDVASGALSLIEIVPCGGRHPRNFALSPDGSWLVCANRDTSNLVVFRVDAVTGRLAPAGQTVHVPLPVCVVFVPAR